MSARAAQYRYPRVGRIVHPTKCGADLAPQRSIQGVRLVGAVEFDSGDMIDQDKVNPEKSKGYYGGGIELVGEKGQKVITANLTFDEETGIARKYTKEQFIRAVRTGVRPDGSILRYPMNPKMSLSEREVGAIYEYLKTVPKIKNDIAKKTAELELAEK